LVATSGSLRRARQLDQGLLRASWLRSKCRCSST